MSEPRPSPVWQLILFRLRALYREPSALFWIFAFPLLTSVALGLAFRSRELSELQVAVVDGPRAQALVEGLDKAEGLKANRMSRAEAEDALRRGRAAVVVVGDELPQLLSDPTQPDARTARLLVTDALERMNGRSDTLKLELKAVSAPGSRYIDFLIPGLLGMGLMSSGIWGIGWALVQMRSGKLLKRLVATPMRRSQFLFSFVVTRSLLALIEIGFFVAFAKLMFDVQVFGSVAAFAFFGLLGSWSFSGLGLLVASRAQNSETASGLMNLVTMPMMGLSGVFFSASNFPGWMQPALKVLPLTALNDGLRAISIDGASIASLGLELGILAAWGLVSYVVALRLFRWQ
jgi:ABC-type multidrug transport system permease subunit